MEDYTTSEASSSTKSSIKNSIDDFCTTTINNPLNCAWINFLTPRWAREFVGWKLWFNTMLSLKAITVLFLMLSACPFLQIYLHFLECLPNLFLCFLNIFLFPNDIFYVFLRFCNVFLIYSSHIMQYFFVHTWWKNTNTYKIIIQLIVMILVLSGIHSLILL